MTTVFIVDDDEVICDSIALLLRSVGIKTKTYCDPQAFLAEYNAEQEGCLITDVRMPHMNGLELQSALNQMHYTLPVIFISGHGDVPMAVEAMRAGALDFIQKPFKDDSLIRRVQSAIEQDQQERALLRQKDEIRLRINQLTQREREIAERIVSGQSNKVIALELELSERTVELHRTRIMQKMQARSLAQLVQMMLRVKSN